MVVAAGRFVARTRREADDASGLREGRDRYVCTGTRSGRRSGVALKETSASLTEGCATKMESKAWMGGKTPTKKHHLRRSDNISRREGYSRTRGAKLVSLQPIA